MPELPEVETVKKGIEKFIGNAEILDVIVNTYQLRTPIDDNFKNLICSARISHYRRKGKYLIIDLSNNYSLICHLGMSGHIKTLLKKPQNIEKHDHILIQTTNGWLVFNDPRRFGYISAVLTSKLDELPFLTKLGIDPFDKNFCGNVLYKKLQHRKTSIKPALLNQSIISGIGNIYASEILFAAGIHPLRPSCNLTVSECRKLAKNIRLILQQAIDNGGSTLHNYQQPDGSLGYFQNFHCVYNKTGQHCPKCSCKNKINGGIRKIVQDGRSTFFCPVKQK